MWQLTAVASLILTSINCVSCLSRTEYFYLQPCFQCPRQQFYFDRVKELEKYEFRLHSPDTMFNDYNDVPAGLYHKDAVYDCKTNTLTDESCVNVKFKFISNSTFRLKFYCDGLNFRVVRFFIEKGERSYHYIGDNKNHCHFNFNKVFSLYGVVMQSDYSSFVTFGRCVKVLMGEIYSIPRDSIFLLEKTFLQRIVERRLTESFPDLDLGTVTVKRNCKCLKLFDKRNCRESKRGYRNATRPIRQDGRPSEMTIHLIYNMFTYLLLFCFFFYIIIYYFCEYRPRHRVQPHAPYYTVAYRAARQEPNPNPDI